MRQKIFHQICTHFRFPATNFNPESDNHNKSCLLFVICCNILEAFPTNSVDPDQTAPIGAV